jgi:GST-like protein
MSAFLELHGSDTGNSLRASVALEEAGLSYSVRHVDLAGDAHRTPAFLALNPAGKIPVLIEHGDTGAFVLSQSNAIILYAAEKKPGLLIPLDVRGRARTYERFFYFITDVVLMSHGGFFIREDHGPEEGAALLEQRAHAAATAAHRFLQDSQFMAGDRFTIADVAAFPIVNHLRASIDWDAHPQLQRWFQRVAARPAVERGMHAFDRH